MTKAKSPTPSKHNEGQTLRFVRKIREKIEVGTKIFDAINAIGDKPKLRNIVGAGLHIADIGIEKLAQRIADKPGEWKRITYREVFLREMIIALKDGAAHVDEISAMNEDDSGTKTIYTLDDNTRVMTDTNNTSVDIYIETESTQEKFNQSIATLIWKRVGSSIELTDEKNGFDSIVKLTKNDSGPPFPSEQGIKLLSRIKSFTAKGVSRSLILEGNPGTGKSSMMKYIAREINGLSMTIGAGDFKSLDGDDIIYAIKLLRPSIIIIDDFDRIYSSDELLSEFEEINRTVSIFMVSVNNLNALSPAIKRPGRFDEIVYIDKMDTAVISSVIPWADSELIEKVSEWPIAFICELAKRADVLGINVALGELEEFSIRTKMNGILWKKGKNDKEDSDDIF